MKRSSDRILTTHVGRLERPQEVTSGLEAELQGEQRPAGFDSLIAASVADVVRRQKEAGIDIVNDGEFGKLSWIAYQHTRISGYELRPLPAAGRFTPRTRDRADFAAFYSEIEAPGRTYFFKSPGLDAPPGKQWACTGPLRYVGHDALQADIRNLKAAMERAGIEDAFMPSTGPQRLGPDEHYRTEDDYMEAIGEARREEYLAIVRAGLVLQIDDPGLTVRWDQSFPAPRVDEFRNQTARRIALLNHMLRDIPQDRVRYHICWGSWHGPHVHDLPFKHVADLLMKLNVQAYVFEAGNARHEHEWTLWRDVKLPEGKMLVPGVVSHATNVVEHPELVASRIANFAGLVGRENVIAGTDCGLGYRVHDQIAWAKLRALTEGAKLASMQLWKN